jgi:quinoprotein glucose dehydrogenase
MPAFENVGGWPVFAGGLVLALVIGAGLDAFGPAKPVDPLWQTGAQVDPPRPLARPIAAISGNEWPHYGNDRGGMRFSPLAQITPENVGTSKSPGRQKQDPRCQARRAAWK